MRSRLIAGILLVALAAFAGDKMQRLNVKTGLWENTTTVTSQGQLPIPAGMLDRLTPDQRARIEARMKAQPNEHSRTYTEKHCVTEKELTDGEVFAKKPNPECSQEIVKSTSTFAEVHMTCAGEGIQGKGTVNIQVLNSENVKGTTQIHANANGQDFNTNSTFTAKWVAASCGNVK